MSTVLLAVGILMAVFVGINIGGSSTGVAFGPAVGAKVVSKRGAAILMTVFAVLGGWTVGRNVVATLGGRIVPADMFTLSVSIAVLFFIGGALFLSNLAGVPASTSMTAVGAIAGLGLATQSLDWAVIGRIVTWWIVSPIIAFWVSGVIGRYVYPRLAKRFAVVQSDDRLLTLDRSGRFPVPRLGPDATLREFVGTVLVMGIGCYMAFSAGASNVANAVAPLVGNGMISMSAGILLAGGAMGLGAFTLARRTLDTMGNDLTDLPIIAALVVAAVSATVVTFLSLIGIPASFVVIATMSIVGLGWGRATRTATLSGTVAGEDEPGVSVGALAADEAVTIGGTGGTPDVSETPIGEEETDELPQSRELFDPHASMRVILTQNAAPLLAFVAAYVLFNAIGIAG
jgi:PiT family inorganic phosphate transporter